jgi:large subunit ribosomal protein L5
MKSITQHKDFYRFAQQYLEKIVVNTGIGRLSQTANFSDKVLPEVAAEFALVTGQKPSHRPARQSIAGFKMRAGTIIGLQSTLRRRRMADFLARLIHIVIPRVRDFRGISLNAIDRGGSLTMGIKEHIVFPEISGDVSKTNFGLQVTVVPKTRRREEVIALYRELGIPFVRELK